MIGYAGLAVCLVLLASTHAGLAAAPSEELNALRAKLEALKRDIERGEGSRSEAADALKSSEQSVSEANRRLTQLAREGEEAGRQLSGLRDEQQQVEARLAKQRSAAARLIYQHYTAPAGGVLQVLASGRDPNAVARTSVYLDHIARARKGVLEDLRRQAQTLAVLGADATKRQHELAAIEEQQRAQRERLEHEHRNRKQVLARISTQVERQRREAGALQRDERRLAKLVQDLAKMLAARKPPPRPARSEPATGAPAGSGAGTAFEQLRGRLHAPVKGELLGRYGSPRSDSGLSWRGLFIQAPAGREVRAVAPGRIVFADWLRGFGNLLILDHGDGFMSLYGNNEALLGRIGDPVRGGDTIAIVGSSGGNPVPGLYFELRHQGKPFDPMGWFNFK